MLKPSQAIGVDSGDFVQTMVGAVEDVMGTVPASHIQQRPSAKGKYVSVTIGPINVDNSDQVPCRSEFPVFHVAPHEVCSVFHGFARQGTCFYGPGAGNRDLLYYEARQAVKILSLNLGWPRCGSLRHYIGTGVEMGIDC